MCNLTDHHRLPADWFQLTDNQKHIRIEQRRVERYNEIMQRRPLKDWETKDLEVATQRLELWLSEE